MFVEHRLIAASSIEHRDYQVNIAAAAAKESTLVVLPTGMGKTVVALIVIADTLMRGEGRVLFLAPTKPLVEQHSGFLRKHLLGFEPVVFTGEVPPASRAESWRDSRLVVSTPQVIENDLLEGRISLSDVDLIVFDEAHRAIGDYAYVTVGKWYAQKGGLVLGMTASPGYDVGKIAEVCENLGITGVEIRSELDEDVVKYTQDVETEYVAVDVQQGMGRITYLLKQIYEEQLKKLVEQGFLDPKKTATTRDLLEAGSVIRARLNSGTKNIHLFRAASVQAMAMKVNHAIELAETQGKGALQNYLDKLVAEGSEKGGPKASRDLVKDARFQQARTLLYGMELDHPKLDKIAPMIKQQLLKKPESRIIVFTHYRDTCELVTQKLADIEGVRPARFVGQATKGVDTGLKQKAQKEIIEKFHKGEFNILVATSIGEEGLDIPTTDLVIFYEPVPSEIRTIQRRGRTGRRRAGRVIVMVTRDTKDEAYFWSSKKKEMQMRRELESLKRKLRVKKGLPPEQKSAAQPLTKQQLEDMMTVKPKEELSLRLAEKKGQRSLGQFQAEKSEHGILTVSARVGRAGLADQLRELGFTLAERDLENADVVVSNRVAVAVRSVDDFIKGISDGSVFSTLAKLKHEYLHPILIVQGAPEGDGSQAGNAAVYDALSSVLAEYHIPTLSTTTPSDTAAAISSLSRQEEAKVDREKRSVQTTLDVPSRQMFLVQGLPNVSATLAQRLLKRFGSVKGIADADVEELMQVDGIGRVIAEGIHEVLRKRFGEEE
ncbi:MAG: DEAD/DEAH box helicase [Candidatus Thermoplasmatota archaeon]|nr:DEAD/DEAH box helicase [Candidatus Thermoplasmatota archaeon]